MRRTAILMATASLLGAGAAPMAEPAQILTNHLGYDPFGPKRAVVRGGPADNVSACRLLTYADGRLAYRPRALTSAGAVDQWRDWRFWTLEFGDLEREGQYLIECQNNGQPLRSFPFLVQHNLLERATLSDVVAYFKSQRSSGALDKADSSIGFQDGRRPRIDARGGWYDASGDYGIHLSQLDHSSYFNNQQVPLVVYNLGRTLELLEARKDTNFNQIARRLIDEAAYGADFLVRMKKPGGSFYQTINAPGPGKKPEDRRIGPVMTGFSIKKTATDTSAGRPQGQGIYESSYRGGGGFSIAGLAVAARLPIGGAFDKATYLRTAEQAFTYLEANNVKLLNDRSENIVDDYSALVAAAELLRTTKKPVYATAARRRAESLLNRLITSGPHKDYWRADDKDRPFFHPSDAGAPVVTLLTYYDLADAAMQARIKDAVKRSLAFELSVTSEVTNPFGLARQYVQNRTGARRTAFFFPHDTETAPWWQGENARLGSLSTAARLAAPLFPKDPAFQSTLESYASDQLNWILGLNPFDASMLHGTGRNNPDYGFFGTWQYKNFPGGIVNGITAGFAGGTGIDFNLPYEVTRADADWRWGEQWLPHAAWYMLAVAARRTSAPPTPKAVIGYVFVEDRVLDPARVPAEKLTHINYAFANIVGGRMVEGFKNDAENLARLTSLKQRNPQLQVLVSVGGWTWSGNFSDMALTPPSRKTFIDSAVAFVERHRLDGLDIDWEYPGQKGMDNIHRPEDRENFTALLAEARAALDAAGKPAGKHYLLTIATGANDAWLVHTDMDKVQASIDFVNLMTYDQYGEWDNTTGHNAPLYTHPDNPKQLSAALVIDHYIAAGVPPAKIVMGVPFYGKAWGSVGAAANGLYQPGKRPDVRLRTFFGNLRESLENKDGFVRYWDDLSGVPYLYHAERQLFISYDDTESMRAKGRYVMDRGLGGMMFWELGSDPKYELIDAMNEAMKVR